MGPFAIDDVAPDASTATVGDLMMEAIIGVVALAVMLLLLERFAPLRLGRAPFFRRLLVNVAIAALTFVAAMAVVQPVALKTLGWTEQSHVGVLHLGALPDLLRACVAFVLMDLSFYYWHQLNHRVPLLWRFHNVHHADPVLDVSTTFRFHFGEIALSTAFRVVQIAVIGPSLSTYLVYDLALQCGTLFHHSNVKLPLAVERIVNWVLVTPRMHGIHHSQVMRESRSNYGVVFPWWDWMHRTLRLNVPQSQVVVGVAGYSLPEDNGILRALAMPFRRQRDYWTRPTGVRVERDDASLESDRTRMAE